MGTGLAPLYGVVRDALQQGHQGKIDLLVGARLASQHYLLDELSDLEKKYDNFSFTAIAQQLNDESNKNGENSRLPQIIEGDLYERLKEKHSDLQETLLYICGAESFIRKVRKHGFSCGLKMYNMLIDSFIPTGL